MRSFLQRHTVLSAAVVIFLIAFIVRCGALKQYVTPDEPSWVWRSINFSRALAEGDWADTAQMGHPGVTTMWLGALGILVKRAADPVASRDALQWLSQVTTLAPENAEAFKHLGIFVTYARIPVIFINALGVVLIYLLVRRLWGQRVGVLAGLLFALDPFTAGLSGLLHVDGLLTTFSVLSILAILNGASSPRPASPESLRDSGEAGDAAPPLPKRSSSFWEKGLGGEMWFALAGAFAGLAFLSKSPGLFLTGFAVVVLFFAVITRRLALIHAVLCLLSFVIVHWALFIALYPAMWVQPLETLGGIFGLASFLGANAVRPTFFDGQYALNHGANFYPVALAFRLTPVLVFGLIVALIALVVAAWKQSSTGAFAVILLLIGAALFVALITPAAKKYDRYMLPAEALLILVAAWGIGQIRSGVVRSLAVIGAAALVLLNWPYLLMHYNALLGGAPEAQKRFAVGWGEGLGAAANWLNRQSDGLQSVVATSAIPSFAPLFSGQARNTFEHDLELSDYYVITLSERQLSPDFYADLLTRGDVVQTLRTGPVDGAWVLRNKQARLQAEALNAADPRTDVIITLVDLPVARAYAGDTQLVMLPRDVTSNELEQILNDLSTRYKRLWFAWSPAVSPVVQQQIQGWLEQTATAVAQPQDFGDTQIAVYDLKPGRIGRIDPFRVQFNGNFALVGVTPVTQGRSGVIVTRWQPLAPLNVPYTVTLQLLDPTGATWKVTGGLIENSDQVAAAQWPIGRAVDQAFRFTLPDEAPPGRYDVRLGIDQVDGTRAGLFSVTGNFSGTAPVLASWDVAPLDQALDRLKRTTEYPFTYRWDDAVEIVGFDSGPGVVINGDLWPVDVVWRGMNDHLRDLQVVWEVRDQTNQKMFSTRLPLSEYPTSLWREGEVISAHYLLRFPVDLKAADYHVLVGVADPDGNLLEGGMFTPFDVRLLHRDRSFDVPQPHHPVDVQFDDPAITLIGADYPTRTLRPGDILPLNLYWQAGSTTDDLYTVFALVETLNGQTIAQIDSQPQGGGMPTASWATGQVITDTYPLQIPLDTPPGAYRVVVGMYNSLDGTHLIDTRTGEGQVVLDPAIVVK
jgi:4-amino-4-deoxy-L-arabinose transferase-like glycosyltransferase